MSPILGDAIKAELPMAAKGTLLLLRILLILALCFTAL